VRRTAKLSATTPGLEGLDARGRLGAALAAIDDLDGDGRRELAVGAPGADDGAGCVWVISLDGTGGVRFARRLTPRTAGLPRADVGSAFGDSLAAIPDASGDGRGELVVAQRFEAGDPLAPAAAWILELGPDGAVRSHRLLAPDELTPHLAPGSRRSAVRLAGPAPGAHPAPLLAVAAPDDAFLEGTTGLVELIDLRTGPRGVYPPYLRHPAEGFPLRYGRALALVDLTGGGVEPLVGLEHDGIGRIARTSGLGAFPPGHDPADPGFGTSLAWLGDLDGDGRPEVACGTWTDGLDAASAPGGFWLLSVRASDETDRPPLSIERWTLVAAERGGFPEPLRAGDAFGAALAAVADGDTAFDVAVGAPGDDDGGEDAGAVWLVGW